MDSESIKATERDITTRLRDCMEDCACEILVDAKAEIERLRKERVNLLGRIRRIACNHKGIGLPGCTVCDPIWERHVDIALGESI